MVQWSLADHLNTVRNIARFDPQTGATTVVNHLVYDAFGNAMSETNPVVDSLFLFTARPFDQDTQLQNNLNRWYDASVGRWLSEDPIGFEPGDGNLYRYVGNATLQIVDPAGYGPRKIVVCVGLTASAGALWGFTAATCAFAFAVGEGAGVVDAAQIAACGSALVGSFATTLSAIDACIEARCDGAVAYLYEIKRDLEWLRAKLNAISVTVGVRL